ncbi:peptidoglycan recognition protein family protein [Streptomyces sp. NBC_00503]|uniref:peptidoglycan recognition protein family protein n=1 Tax=Streptomyces sp. NBC_00503 TaxID=2903659 RepID=UPI002E8109C5|nr:N-acetylmuramoyl-L-alanine amidase [Streptomyces sp. NBC_00503]WUD81180.1 N-acetylmuramoyl-L-alanine amidase [Streptomyces sp. NBC_00503]
MRTRRIWLTAATTTTVLCGVLALQRVTGNGPARPEVRTVALEAGGAGATFKDEDTSVFSMLAVSWNDPGRVIEGGLQVRTRAEQTGEWSRWTALGSEGGAASDGASRPGLRGASEPMWAGPSDGVEVRVTGKGAALPAGLRLDMVDPGSARAVRTGPAAFAVGARASARSALTVPQIVSRAEWGADESLSPEEPAYGNEVKAVFVHHTAQSNAYDCADSAAIMRGLHTLHVKTNGWKDIGYDFVVDKCGTVFEGRKGGTDRPVTGAHTLGFNTDTTGIAVIGDYTDQDAPDAATDAVARIAAWKLAQYGYDPAGSVTLPAVIDNGRFKPGQNVTLQRISGHRDGFTTECPGTALYGQLPLIRARAAALATAP